MKKPVFCKTVLNTTNSEYQGWTNSATWCFNLYVQQEREYYEHMANLAEKGEFTVDHAMVWFATLPIKIEPWCKGNVNVSEIVEAFNWEFEQYPEDMKGE